MPKQVGMYEIQKTLGEGTFGKVKKAKHVISGEVVAIKVLDKEKILQQNMGGQVKKEISIMKLIKHPHIVELYEVLASKTKIFIVLECITGGELFDKIVDKGRLDEETSRYYFQQLCVATEFCHRQGVCHRDLKPENLLLDAQGNLKISDFGLSALYEAPEGTESLLYTTCGTPNYVAPEVIADKGYVGTKADTWSIGVILFVFLAGFLPFDEQTMPALFRKIQRAEYKFPNWFSAEVKDLIGKIIVVDSNARWTISDIITHVWWAKSGPYANINAQTIIEAHTVTQNLHTYNSARHIVQGQNPSTTENMVGQPTSQVPPIEFQNAEVRQTQGENPAGTNGMEMTNAFEIIGMATGGILNNIGLGEKKKFLYLSPHSKEDVMKLLMGKFETINGFLSQEQHKGGNKLKAEFDRGRGRVKVKVSVKLASAEPLLCLVIVKRAGGDIVSFQQISAELDAIGELLQRPN